MKRDMARRDFLKTLPAAYAIGMTNFGAQAVKIGTAAYTSGADYAIRPKRGAEVRINDRFWKPKLATNARVTIPLQMQKFAQAERNFSVNVLEAAILSLQTHPDPTLEAEVDRQVRALASQTWRGNSNFEVAAAYFQATGKRDLLGRAIETAGALYEDFRLNDPPFSGGERDAINCVQLYRVTRDKKHLELAKHYLDIRGLENSVNRSRHNQSYKPVVEQSEAVGHAVNCVSLMLSLADVGVLTGLKEYFNAAQRMWTDIVERKMYVTGGAGSTGNEGFGDPYSLPNISAYSETCAVLMFITFNHRMFLATGDSRYIDVMERGMYNNALCGVATSGDRFFYVNRLASAGDGRDLRWERASLECCPPNLVRFLAAMPGFIYAQDKRDAVYINLYVSSDASFTIGGKELALSVESEMPWGGLSRITVSTREDVRGTIKLRIPGWTRNQPVPSSLYAYSNRVDKQTTISVNGKPVSATPDKMGYVSIERMWQNGDTIDTVFPFEVRHVTADSRVRENRGRVAIERGPIVYCLEWPESGDGHVLELLFNTAGDMKPRFDASILGGVNLIETEARRMTQPSLPPKAVTLIPYYLWANRGPGEMSVWLSTRELEPGDTGPAGGYIFYKNGNPSSDGWRYLEAAPFDQSAGAKWGCFRRMIPGARGT
ncbi:MAG: glycoside hydrolase family 127 protein, partial [Acidobacteria bacterium]|nr:glycoside hydrolase family 127 protein [Acidobacteriota bacterium]